MALRPARLSGVHPYAHEVQPRDARVDVPDRKGSAYRDDHRHISREVQPALSVGGMQVPLLQAFSAAASREALPPGSLSSYFADVPRRFPLDGEEFSSRLPSSPSRLRAQPFVDFSSPNRLAGGPHLLSTGHSPKLTSPPRPRAQPFVDTSSPHQHCVHRDAGPHLRDTSVPRRVRLSTSVVQYPIIHTITGGLGRGGSHSVQDRDNKRPAPPHAGASRSVGFHTHASSDKKTLFYRRSVRTLQSS